MVAANLSLSVLKENDEDTAKKQHARFVEALINNDRTHHRNTPGWG